MSNRIVDLEKERDIQKTNKPHYPKKEDNNQWQVPPPNLASINITKIGSVLFINNLILRRRVLNGYIQ